jgi:hypothetical protein
VKKEQNPPLFEQRPPQIYSAVIAVAVRNRFKSYGLLYRQLIFVKITATTRKSKSLLKSFDHSIVFAYSNILL